MTDHMPGDETPTTEIVRHVQAQPAVAAALPIMDDEEIRKTWRIAKALAESGMFKDTNQAGQAFAKILIGRDLGLGPTQAMMGIDLVRGGIQMRAVLLGRFIKASGKYDYRVREHDEQHCIIDFYEYGPNGKEKIGDSEFKMEEAERVGLTKPSPKGEPSMYVKWPKNMLWARTLSNGTKHHCPDVLGGMPVYTEGDSFEDRSLTAGEGEGEPAGIDLDPRVEEVMVRAQELGHAGLSDRGTVEMRVGSQSPAYVEAWIKGAHEELDKIDPEKTAEGSAVEEGAGA